MEAYLIYILKSSLLLSFFWGIYVLFLKKETFFYTNRWFLLLGILTALILPQLHFIRIVELQTSSPLISTEHTLQLNGSSADQFNLWTYAFYFYIIGTLAMSIQFLMELLSLSKIVSSGKLKKQVGRIKYIEVGSKTSPFSFFNNIVYNPELHTTSELETILKHEKVHVIQKHSIDILLITIVKITLWFNPLSWSYKKYLAQNLEYIADFESCLQSSSHRKNYQYLLLNQLSGISYSIINPFFNSLIKKRILMLQKQRSHKRSSWKYALILPLLIGFTLLFSFKTQVNYSSENQQVRTDNLNVRIQDSLPPLYILNGVKQAADFDVNSINPEDIESISVLKGESAMKSYGSAGKHGAILIQLKKGRTIKATPAKEVTPSKAQPLIIVDDKKMSENFDYNSIDPNTIESVEVLKDQSATKAYGKQAKDGVIKIYTKKKD